MTRLTITVFNDIEQDRLDDLISGFFVRGTRKRAHLTQYLKCTRQRFFARESVLRLTQSIVNHLPNKLVLGPNLRGSELYLLYTDFFARLSIPLYELANKLTHLLEPVISFEKDNLRTLRNVCLVGAIVSDIYKKSDYSLEIETLEKLIDKLTDIVTQCEHSETVFYALIALENWLKRRQSCEISDTNPGLSNELIRALTPLCAFIEENQLTIYDLPIHETQRFSISFTARWLLSHYRNSSFKADPIVKMSSCGLIAGSSHIGYKQYPVRSAYPIHNMAGIFYYEVLLLTSGEVSVGWSTREATFGDFRIFTSYAHLLERRTGLFYHPEHKRQPDWVEWLPGDVMGCLIDANQKCFVFYLNGREIECPQKKVHFSTQPYYATAMIGEQSCCYFNFGQLPFKHPPKLTENRAWSSFHQVTDGRAEAYCLLQPQIGSHEDFWFKQPITNPEDHLFFTLDDSQMSFNTWVLQLHSALAANLPETDPIFSDLKSNVKEMLKKAEGNNVLRLTQSLIEVSAADENLVNDEAQLEALFNRANLLAFLQPDDYWRGNSFEFIHIYLQLPATNPRHRSFLAFSSVAVGFIYQAFKVHYMFRAFIEAALEQENKWILKIIHNCLTPLTFRYTYGGIHRFFNYSANVRELQQQISRLKENFTAELGTESIYEYFSIKMKKFQLVFTAQAALRLLSTILTSMEINDTTTEWLEFSGDSFAVANCGGGQATTQSGYKCVNAATRSYYYEAILLSPGNITVGWASRSRGFNRDNGVGSDPRSIGFSVKLKTIHNDAITPITEAADAQEGDVVGCLLDGRHRRFAFYLNGVRVQMPPNVHYFDQHSYFAAATLTGGQKCYFNFGQLPFKYAPEEVENLTSFHTATHGNEARYRLIGINAAG